MMGVAYHSQPARSASPALSQAASWRLRGNLGGSRHERRVAAIAVKLFDLLHDQHGLSRKYRNLLAMAAVLHDAAKVYGSELHDVRGAQMALEDRSLPLSPRQRRGVAWLIRYHRGTVPKQLEDQSILLCGDKHRKLRILLGLLRAADALDSRKLRPQTIIIRRGWRKLRICCIVRQEVSEARRRLGGRSKFELLGEELSLAIKFQIERVMEL